MTLSSSSNSSWIANRNMLLNIAKTSVAAASEEAGVVAAFRSGHVAPQCIRRIFLCLHE